MKNKILLFGAISCVFFLANTASAHQPRLVWDLANSHDSPIVVSNPEISQAFYGTLKNKPEYYEIKLDEPAVVYLNLLTPDNIDAAVNTSARVFKLNSSDSDIKAFLNGKRFNWESYYEDFAGDYYMKGPESSTYLKTGKYLVEITSEKNDGKYVLVVGQKESFPLNEAMSMVLNLPKLKLVFFEEPVFMLASGIIGKLIASLFLFLLLLALMSLRKVREKKNK